MALAPGATTLTERTNDRIFNAPLVAVLLAVSLPVLFWLQEGLDDRGMGFAFRAATLWTGGWWPGLFTSMFVHANWTHVAMNAVGAFAFAPPVARLMAGPRGVIGFLIFYIVCGLAGTLGFALMHPNSFDSLVGASGAVFGLTGAALRVLGWRRGGLRPLLDRQFLLMSAVLMAVNLGVGLIGMVPGAEGGVAWEAHAFGFVAGALLIGPWVRLFGRRAASFDSPADLRDPSV